MEGSARFEAGRAYLSSQLSYVFPWFSTILLGWRFCPFLTRVLIYAVCGSVMSPFFRLQGGDVFNKREYNHFDMVDLWNVVGFGFRLVLLCTLGVWKRVGF